MRPLLLLLFTVNPLQIHKCLIVVAMKKYLMIKVEEMKTTVFRISEEKVEEKGCEGDLAKKAF